MTTENSTEQSLRFQVFFINQDERAFCSEWTTRENAEGYADDNPVSYGRFEIIDRHFHLPLCCVDALQAETKVTDGLVIECPTCQRGVDYHITTGWRRFWKPCDMCERETSAVRRQESSEPPEGAFCQSCGRWVCPECAFTDERDSQTVCQSCYIKPRTEVTR